MKRQRLANAIRVLSMDAIQKARSGHPGAPLGMADIAEVLWNDFLVHNPADPAWSNRDRFVLSNGHGSMLLYALLHLTGYDLDMEELKRFRQLHSKTPGHPEQGVTPGVEATSGPLGQGIAGAVGMAVAEKVLAAHFNREMFDVVDHYTYVFLGDGCMMEGVSHEACSLAGTLKLGKLIALYDDNGISIDGDVDGWFTDDTTKRFSAYGWHVVRNVDGHDPEAVRSAIEQARRAEDRPSLICCRTVIGKGAPTACGSEKCHGAPLGEEEIARARQDMGWVHPPFEIPDDVYEAWNARARGAQIQETWERMFTAYANRYPELAAEFTRRMAGDLPDGFTGRADDFMLQCDARGESLATRKASQRTIEHLAPTLPELFGGSADLAGSNLTRWSGSTAACPDDWSGNYMHYGVREFAMAAMMNGMALHGGFIPYGGTFLVFSDYARNALRMSALMGLRTLHVLTHDSIGVGEDGPTHQPVEHVTSLRIIPNMRVWRPCDTVETAVAWKEAVTRRKGPTALVLSRQTLPHQKRDMDTMAQIACGGYVLLDCDTEPEAILLASGSEVGPAMEAAWELIAMGHAIRVVSMPCMEAFMDQSEEYRNTVLPPQVATRVAVEAGTPESWFRFVSPGGTVIGMERFGESAPGERLFSLFGFTPGRIILAVESLLADRAEPDETPPARPEDAPTWLRG